MSDEPPCEVGYGRPPRHTRSRKRRSGNPAGRSKGAKNLATLIAEALDRRVAVSENGKRRRITGRKAIIAALVNKSASADLKALALLLRLVQQAETRSTRGTRGGAAGTPASPTNASSTTPTTAADQAVIAGLIARLSRTGENP